MLSLVTKKILIAVAIVAIVAVGITLAVVFIGGDDDDDDSDTTIIPPTSDSTTQSSSQSTTTKPPNIVPRTVKIPVGFDFGSATAAYQIEGGWNADGKGPSVWDTFTHNHPEKIDDRSSGDIASNSYGQYQEDVDALASIGAQSYRFSIAMSRVLPTGDISSRNEPGIQYYHKLIDALLAKGIQPRVTMYHWDLPQYLQDLGGWTNPIIIDYFEEYANLLFIEYGAKVKTWITFNEPMEYCVQGYGAGVWAPALNLHGVGEYLCSHHTILANARIYHLYKDKYFASQQGQVGITLNAGFAIPKDENNPDDVAAADRSMQFSLGLYAHPIFTQAGDYPKVLRERIDENSKQQGYAWSRLPKFTDDEVKYVKGTSDFFGYNYYTSNLVESANVSTNFWQVPSKDHDTYIISTQDPSWPKAKSYWLASVPEGFYKVLTWIRDNYQNPETIITENGWSDDGQIKDVDRIKYLEVHFEAMVRAIDDGCNVTGHMTWSLLDNFEWLRGYTEKFGIVRVDADTTELKRIPKDSSVWLTGVFKNREYTINEN